MVALPIISWWGGGAEAAFMAAFYTAKILRISIDAGVDQASKLLKPLMENKADRVINLTHLEKAGKVLQNT
jgi:hypothetical protein